MYISSKEQGLLDPTCRQPLCKNSLVNIEKMADPGASEDELNFVQVFFRLSVCLSVTSISNGSIDRPFVLFEQIRRVTED
ncbi:hypothetical protein F2P81_009899 [Scophthalmus maximus]|uniref:Uncharacterized protein n=1 Tax=Scophthalmus maximus TaxID=52904 RepID=A0A6A4SWC9_SCOMX|nr:hypothetical protein F2P81_009899 [Scophthalmus maximus]